MPVCIDLVVSAASEVQARQGRRLGTFILRFARAAGADVLAFLQDGKGKNGTPAFRRGVGGASAEVLPIENRGDRVRCVRGVLEMERNENDGEGGGVNVLWDDWRHCVPRQFEWKLRVVELVVCARIEAPPVHLPS